jgi:CRISPR/Cas system-associated protein Cas10 (large subunit of type III CRISPR-Cas system)
MSKYLYGASVQGIQEFILKTNKLKEIIGASKIVEDMDNIKFQKEYGLKEEPEILLQAAGNIRLVFNNIEDLEKVVKNFPKDRMLEAYGITISQAVVKYINDYKIDSKELEKKLKIQRNKVSLPIDFHFNILKQNPRTALPLVSENEDKATNQKVERFQKFANEQKSKDRKTIFDIEKLSNDKNKIAIIHADGNGLGNIVKDLAENEIVEFSKRLDEATKKAYKTASFGISEIRKVILGGDDLTVIINANKALTFTKKFLEEFEKNTKKIYKDYDLTACAGITYCNEKYPFHYAVKLAEDLCKHAKKDSKDFAKKQNLDLAPSSFMFHNIQSSNVENFSKLIEDELTINKKEI